MAKPTSTVRPTLTIPRRRQHEFLPFGDISKPDL